MIDTHDETEIDDGEAMYYISLGSGSPSVSVPQAVAGLPLNGWHWQS